jgi:two-component system chemotaxis response regulator CheY
MSGTGETAACCLVVDDSRVVRKAARRIVETLGFTVREAEDGAQALAACREAMPKVVLLDWNMPVMDGISFLRAARAEFGPDRPVEALEAGAQEYIMKPFDAALLQDKFVQAGLLPDQAA